MQIIRYACFAHADDGSAEWSDARLAFQHNSRFTERYATVEPDLAKPMPVEALHQSTYTRDTVQRCSIMAGETALMVAARILIFLEPRLNHQRFLSLLQHNPEQLDLLLNIPSRPQSTDVPHCQSNFLAMFILRLYLAPPGMFAHVAWLFLNANIPLSDWASVGVKAFDESMEIFGGRQDALNTLKSIYHRTSPLICQSHRELYR